MFEQLANVSPTTLPAILPRETGLVEIDAGLAILLQEAAAEANAAYARVP